ncbi:MAG TPA: DUF5004 domain-containing protein [Gemmataceae bacterium]|nr:DUF5004 domain-containing protein [Gemmataceae bacterium]
MNRHRYLAVVATLTWAGWGLGGGVEGERAKLQGTWKVVELTKEGKQEAAAADKNMRMVFAGDKFMMKGSDADYEGTFTLDPSKNPKRLDTRVVHGKDKVITTQGIYRLEGDTLKIAWTEGKAERPQEFAVKPGSGVRMIVLKRAGR